MGLHALQAKNSVSGRGIVQTVGPYILGRKANDFVLDTTALEFCTEKDLKCFVHILPFRGTVEMSIDVSTQALHTLR